MHFERGKVTTSAAVPRGVAAEGVGCDGAAEPFAAARRPRATASPSVACRPPRPCAASATVLAHYICCQLTVRQAWSCRRNFYEHLPDGM